MNRLKQKEREVAKVKVKKLKTYKPHYFDSLHKIQYLIDFVNDRNLVHDMIYHSSILGERSKIGFPAGNLEFLVVNFIQK